MRTSTVLSAVVAVIPLTQACYRTHGTIQQFTNKVTYTTLYVPQIYLEKNGAVICDGIWGPGMGEKSNPYNAAFVPGAIPTNTSFAGPWVGYNCTDPTLQVELQGVLGQALIRDYDTAFYVNPEDLAWSQPATSQGLAGIANTVASYWTFDSGSVHC